MPWKLNQLLTWQGILLGLKNNSDCGRQSYSGLSKSDLWPIYVESFIFKGIKHEEQRQAKPWVAQKAWTIHPLLLYTKLIAPCPMVSLCSHCQPEYQPTIISWALSWNHTFQMASTKRNFRDWKSDPHTSDFLSVLLDILFSSQGHLDQNKSGNTEGFLRRGRKEQLEWGVCWQTVGLKC